MTSEPSDSALAALQALRAAERERRAAEARRFMLLCEFADACSVSDHPDGSGLVEVGHEGTPLVQEFAELEVAAALHMSSEQAATQLGLALDVRHRLPRAWSALERLELRVWQAEDLAGKVAELGVAAARAVDAQLAPGYGHWSHRRLAQAAEGLVLQALPAGVAEARQAAARDARRVDFLPAYDGTQAMSATLDAVAGAGLAAQVARIAHVLQTGGSSESLDARRAQALGLLASPARALQLLQCSLLEEPLPADPCPLAGQAGHTCGSVTVDPERLQPPVELVVHVTAEDLCGATGVARSPRLGALTAQSLRAALTGCSVHIRPVVRVESLAPADAYEVPAAMREAVMLRNPASVFPFSSRTRGMDLDHTQPYVAGVVGQTRPDNLGPLSRREHRAKTHGGWRVTQPLSGVFVWRSPLGLIYLVTQSGTWELSSPTETRVMRAAA